MAFQAQTEEVEAKLKTEVVAELNTYSSKYNNKTATSSQMYMGSECKGFANWIFLKIFGVYIGPYSTSANYKITNPNAKTLGIIEPGNLNINTAKQLLQKGAPGDYIQVQRSTARGRGPHSMILKNINDSGIEVLDCNSDRKNTIKTYWITWSQFDTANRAMSLYRANGYDPNDSSNVGINPIGSLDSISDAVNAIKVRGWTLDKDDITKQLKVHVYIGGPAGSGASGYIIDANTYRPDVEMAHKGVGEYHGFESEIITDKVGIQTIYVYAINIESGDNVLLGSRTVNISKDIEKPNMSDVTVSKVTSTGYKVSCRVNDNTGITKVLFPSWHTSATSADVKWYEGKVENGIASCNISALKLGNKKGTYITDIYAYDRAGNEVSSRVRTEINTVELTERKPVNIGKEFSAYIQKVNDKKRVVSVGSTEINVTNKTDIGADQQRWIFRRNSDDSYTIISKFNNKCLDSSGGTGNSEDNVQVYQPNGTDAQKWFIYQSDNGGYWLRPKCSSTCVLDVTGNSNEESANIQIYKFNATDAQSFKIVNLKPIEDYEMENVGDDFYATISNLGIGKVLTVGSTKVNVVSRSKRDGSDQYWKFKRNEDGSYTITSQSNSKCLDSYGGTGNSGDNVQVYQPNGKDSQKWIIYKTEEGAYYFRPKCSKDCVLDVIGYDIDEGANVAIATFDSSTEQKYLINKCSHKFTEGEVKNKASCEQDGSKIYTCTECGAVKEEKISALGHQFEDWKIIEKASCIQDGEKSRKCDVCGKSETEVIKKTGHQYVEEIKEATCTENGEKNYNCSLCKDHYSEAIEAIGHDYEDKKIEATSTSPGYTLHECTVCKYSYKSNYINPTNHQYSVTETIPAKCMVDGYKKYKCSDCGDSYMEKIPALGHNYKEEIIKPTCTTKGYKMNVCTNCGESYKTNFVNEVAHSFSSEVINKATCMIDGLKRYTCEKCQKIKTEIIPAVGHSYQTNIIEADCKNNGYTLHKCKYCGEAYKDNYTDQIDHDYQKEIIKKTTCLENGQEKNVCKYCGKSYVTDIKKTGHNYELKNIVYPTCDKEGGEKYICTNCQDSYEKVIPAKSHQFVKKVIKPTELTSGYTMYRCEVCDSYYIDDYVEALNNVQETESKDEGDKDTNSQNGDSQITGNHSSINEEHKKKKEYKVSKISLSGVSKKIAAGKKIELKAKVSPSNASNKGVTWKSSNKKVATVNSKGVVTIKKKTGGKSVTITATAKDGSKRKATYKIKVMKGIVKKVSISGKKTVKAGKTLKLKAKISASKGANRKIKWTCSNTKYATVSSSGKVKAKKAGKRKKIKITAMATDGSGKKKTITIKIK